MSLPGVKPAKQYVRRVDPIVNADIYMPLEPGIQKKVSDNVTIINSAVSSFQRSRSFIPCPTAFRQPNDELFQRYLDVYQANQLYYLDHRKDYNDSDYYLALRELEDWFVSISEPCCLQVDYEGWCKREKKRLKGISYYCEEEAREVMLGQRKK